MELEWLIILQGTGKGSSLLLVPPGGDKITQLGEGGSPHEHFESMRPEWCGWT